MGAGKASSIDSSVESYPSLIKEQESIAYASPEARQLVLAPPGTGKTHVVIARLEYLVTEELLEPYQLAVLCFTRAAVSEITRRVTHYIADVGMHDDLRFVSVRTFDSFATRLLIATQPDIDLSGKGYDERIQMATRALQNLNSGELLHIENYKHVIVDEIQDLVGVRAELVKELLKRISGGFTLLGDPAQAIYGFSNICATNTQTLIDWVCKYKWPSKLERKELTFNHRSSGTLAELTNNARQLVLGDGSDDQAEFELRQMLGTLPSIGSTKQAEVTLKSSIFDRICILCRTNGELLQLASLLSEQGIGFNIKPRVEEYALPPWLGRVLSEYTDPQISERIFQERWNQLVGEDELIDPEKAFHWLKIVAGSTRQLINMGELRRRLYRGYRLPDEADAGLYSGGVRLSLSTIHASKGQEYEHVIILEQNGSVRVRQSSENREEARVLYVAATRAKEVLSQLSRDGIPTRLWKTECATGHSRWLSRSSGGHIFMEIGHPMDVDRHSYVSTYLHKHRGDVVRLQHLLWDKVRPGMLLDIQKKYVGKKSFFRIGFAEETDLELSDFAQTSLPFLNDLKCVLRKQVGQRFSYPTYWNTVRVARVVTEVLPPFPDKIWSPYDRSGFLLGIRVKGMVYVTGGKKHG